MNVHHMTITLDQYIFNIHHLYLSKGWLNVVNTIEFE